MRPGEIATIGYEGAALEEVVATLAAAGVERVCDVRAVTASRKPGFSKTALAAALAAAGIGYTHLRALGTPKAGRQAARRGDRDRFVDVMHGQLATPEAQMALAELAELAASQAVCLLCFERDPAHCHRSLIVDELATRRPLEVRHLYARQAS
jgi:uncharacterized protein (DUF488 family)